MRALLLPCPRVFDRVFGMVFGVVLAGALVGCAEQARVESFTATGPRSFLYAAATNTVMAANDDGTAERIRRSWIADAVMVNALCLQGYVIETRRFVPDPVGNGGAILYQGRCIDP